MVGAPYLMADLVCTYFAEFDCRKTEMLPNLHFWLSSSKVPQIETIFPK